MNDTPATTSPIPPPGKSEAAPSLGPDSAATAPPAADPAMEAALDRIVRRLDRRARRKTAAALREASFGWLADGFSHQEIAAARKVSVAVVRRDIARAIRARQAETREGHAQLQIARLTKGLALVADRIERGELAAVGPLVKLVTALDRYGAPGPARAPARLAAAGLPAPPLALTHAAPPLADGASAEAAGRMETEGKSTPDSSECRQPLEIMESRDPEPAPETAKGLK